MSETGRAAVDTDVGQPFEIRERTDSLGATPSDKFSLDNIGEAFQQAEWEGKSTSVSRVAETP